MSKVGISFKGGLALGFGGLGIVKFLQEHNLQPEVVAGSSAGALVAACYAAQIPADKVVSKLKGIHLGSNITLSSIFRSKSLLREDLIPTAYRDITDGHEYMIQDLPTKLVVFATDPDTADRVFIEKGSLLESIQASSAFPGVFTLTKVQAYGGRKFIDGDLTIGYSAGYLRSLGAEKIIGVRFNSQIPMFPNDTIISRAVLSVNIQSRALENIDRQLAPVDLELQYDIAHHNYFSFKGIEFSVNSMYEQCVKHKAEIFHLFQG